MLTSFEPKFTLGAARLISESDAIPTVPIDVIAICLLADISTESVFELSTNLPLFNTI